MDMKVKIMFLFMGLLFTAPFYGTAARLNMGRQNLEVKRHLSRLNKSPIKSIKSPDGDIIDCVHIEHQPAFDHPLLRNHTIQMRPNYHPEGLFSANKKVGKISKGEQKTITQMWHMNGRCPEGTIPIRRTKKEDLLRASTLRRYGMKKHKTIPRPSSANVEPDLINQNGHQHAIAYVEGDQYYGAKATINVWDPKIQQPNEFSLSQLWILGGSFSSDLNSIEAGWQVSPDLYGDSNTRFFTYWTICKKAPCGFKKSVKDPLDKVISVPKTCRFVGTHGVILHSSNRLESDAYQATGCYNLLCSGFIQINNEIAMGASIYPISSYQNSQYDISILVWKDPQEGNWWMQFGKDKVLGYWPSFLFSYLSDSASMIEWGGEIVNSQSDGMHTTTQMGSGHFPNEGFGKASYIRNVQVVDESNNLRAPKDLTIFTEQSNCYAVKLGNNGEWGNYFYYGGPGRNPDCQ